MSMASLDGFKNLKIMFICGVRQLTRDEGLHLPKSELLCLYNYKTLETMHEEHSTNSIDHSEVWAFISCYHRAPWLIIPCRRHLWVIVLDYIPLVCDLLQLCYIIITSTITRFVDVTCNHLWLNLTVLLVHTNIKEPFPLLIVIYQSDWIFSFFTNKRGFKPA